MLPGIAGACRVFRRTAVNTARKQLSLESLHRIRTLWKHDVHALTLSELEQLGQGLCSQHSLVRTAQRTHIELIGRLAERLQDLLFLPYKAMLNPNMRQVYDEYVVAYNVHEDIGRISSPEAVSQYWQALDCMLNDHKVLISLLGLARRQLVSLDTRTAPTLDDFIDRFLVSRIGTRLLVANFLHYGPAPAGASRPDVANAVLQQTDVAEFVEELAESFDVWGGVDDPGVNRVPVQIRSYGNTDPINYIPAHLGIILREVLRNAIGATANRARLNDNRPKPVRVKVRRGKFGVFITVSDRGGGIEDVEKVWRWGTEECESPDEEAVDLELAGLEPGGKHSVPDSLPLGFGLPLARLHARYFGGDLYLVTLLGHGTTAYVHIPELREELQLDVTSSSWDAFS